MLIRAVKTAVSVAALLAALFASTNVAPAGAQDQCDETILLVSGDNGADLGVGDGSLIAALRSRRPAGSNCVTVVEETVTVSMAESFDVVAISSSVAPAALGDRLVDAKVPILVSEPFLFDDMAMMASRRSGELSPKNTVFIADPDHPLSAGLSGLVTVYSGDGSVNFGASGIGTGLELVGKGSVASNRSTIFGFESGSQLADRVAPAGRVGFFASAGAELSVDGRALVNAAIDWLVTGPSGRDGQIVGSGSRFDNREPSTRRAIMVVGNAGSVSPADAAILTRLAISGFEVELVDDDTDLDDLDTSGIDFVAVSTSVIPQKVGATLKDTTVAIVVWEGHLYEQFGMATEAGETSRMRSVVTVTDSDSALVAGLGAANRTVYEEPNRFNYGIVGGDARVVAHEVNEPDKAVVFSYGAGDELADGSVAAGQRIALFASHTGAQVMSNQGLDIFDAAWSSLTGVNVHFAAEANGGTMTSPVLIDGDGNPVIGVTGSGGLAVVHCDDAYCRGDDESNPIGAAAGPATAVDAEGNPVLFFHAFGEFHLVHCNDPNCAGGDESDSVIDRQLPTRLATSVSLAVGDDRNPVLAYSSDVGLKLMNCNDPSCAGGDEAVTIIDHSNRGSGVKVSLDPDGIATLGYTVDAPPGTFQIVRCSNAACTSTDAAVGDVDGVGSGHGFVLDGLGNPVVVTADPVGLWSLVHCNDLICGGGDEVAVELGHSGTPVALGIDERGNPIVAIWVEDNDRERLDVIVCNDPNCEGNDEFRTVVDRSIEAGPRFAAAIAVDPNGRILIAYGAGEARVDTGESALLITQGHKLAVLD